MKTKVLFFYTPNWCSGCIQMKQKFYDEVKQHDIKYDLVNVDEPEGVELSCTYGVRNVPTLVYLKGNKVVGVEKGNESYKTISKYANKL